MAGIKAKVENKSQYDDYVRELAPVREELGVNLKEDLYPGNSDDPQTYHEGPWWMVNQKAGYRSSGY